MDMIGRIRRLHVRGKKSEREISRMTGLSRNTVAKWLHEPSAASPPKYIRGAQALKLTPFHEALERACASRSGGLSAWPLRASASSTACRCLVWRSMA